MLFGILEIELKQWAFDWEMCCRTEKVDRCTAEITEVGRRPEAEGARQNSQPKAEADQTPFLPSPHLLPAPSLSCCSCDL